MDKMDSRISMYLYNKYYSYSILYLYYAIQSYSINSTDYQKESANSFLNMKLSVLKKKKGNSILLLIILSLSHS